ncbi:energy-coupling factor transporter ATP-binding protein EcfA2 [Nocardioides thalensis]|uniref:Energy-coupling factor transporter ATP-binding protein EcfA2 n=1 Tax=Nocardioides thalensis TaxID=1914755 RepID=A0A853BZM7_9ACTN|nr:energy-coupling factor transporter ATP-binding protein EcfA2 [Nocardioides thalensis]
MSTVPVARPRRSGARSLARDLSSSVVRLHAAFEAAALPLDLSSISTVREERGRVIAQVDDYVLPRLAGLDGPALVVVGGPTGAGKSTLVNSLTGQRVTTPGLLRPTTRSPVLAHHPADREWFGPDRVLPSLDRVDRPTTSRDALQLVETTAVPRGVALLDAPDFDSIDDANRELATKLLAAADLLLFVTSAARYSDQVPWLQLSLALERQTTVAVVMNRVPADDMATVSSHLATMLRATAVPADQMFFVEEGVVDGQGILPAHHLTGLRRWLDALAADSAARSAAVRHSVRGAIRRAVAAAPSVAEAATLQVQAVSELLAVADRVYAGTADALRGALADGTLVRGDLVAQWLDLVGDLDPATAPDLVTDLRRRLPGRDADRAARVDRLGVALDIALETLLVDHAAQAAEAASTELKATAHGSALLDWSTDDLTRPGRGLASQARKVIRAWRQRFAARVALELGTDPAADVERDMLAIALVLRAASARDGHRPDEPDDVTTLVDAARDGLVRALTALLAEDRDRYLQPVLEWNLAPDAPARLRAAADDAARTLAQHERQGA